MSKQSFDEFFAQAMGRDPKECGAHPYQRAIAKERGLPAGASDPPMVAPPRGALLRSISQGRMKRLKAVDALQRP